jgi:5-methylcytosine-specific restriction endonuclease McrA
VIQQYILDIEKYLAHQVRFVFHDNQGGKIQTPFSKTLEPFIDKTSLKLIKNRSYHILDFNDFLDYSTSDLPKEIDIQKFHNFHIYCYGTYNESYESPGVISSEDNKFSIMGALLSRKNNELGIMMQIRVFDQFYLSDKAPDIVKSRFSEQLLNPNHNFPYIFIYLTIKKTNEGLVEMLRSEMIPPIILGGEDYSIHCMGIMDYNVNLPLHTTYPQLLEQDREVLYERDQFYFEVARLIPFIPSYFDFMDDLVLEKKIKIGNKPSKLSNKTKKVKKTGKPVYKIIKSIKISYQSEEDARSRLSAPRRTWTPPDFKFMVKGHWRKLKNQSSIGHDQNGNEILGKTWVNTYEKGNDTGEDKTEVITKQPNITIELKQPIAHARDILKSYKKEQPTVNIFETSDQSHSSDKPSESWMYEERKKLTAGLRYLIMTRDNYRCLLCGASGTEKGVRLEVDHIKPIAKWGKTEESNLRTLCKSCNKGKGTTT